MIPKQAGYLHDVCQSGGKGAATAPTILQVQSPLSHSGALTLCLYVYVFMCAFSAYYFQVVSLI